jgi:phosphonate transport system substrate-binding protein
MKRQIILASIAVFAAIGVMSVPLTQTAQAESLVPDWIKSNAGWWSDGTLDDETFLNGIKYLVENGVIDVSSESSTMDVDAITI